MARKNQKNTELDKSRQRAIERRSNIVCIQRYCNTLPEIPYDLKFISCPLKLMRHIDYKPTSLDRSYKYDVLVDLDLGVQVDLLNRDLYRHNDPECKMDFADEKLLEEDMVPHDSKRSMYHAKSVSWLRRTEYISTEKTRFQPQTIEKIEAKVGYNIKKNFKEETLYMDRESQMKAIEKTFEDNKKPIEKHYSKPNVYAVETLNVFPDFKNWKYPFAQVIFDSDPAPVGQTVPAQIEEMSQAMIRGVMDENGEQFVAYFLPTKETVIKRHDDAADKRLYDDTFDYEYKMTREYNWNVKSKNTKDYEENYFLNIRPDGVFYNELETRVCLSKRRQKTGTQNNSTNTKLIIRHVPITEKESSVHKLRGKQLQLYDEEEDKVEEATKKIIIGESEINNAGSDGDISNDDVKQNIATNSKRKNYNSSFASDKSEGKMEKDTSIKNTGSHISNHHGQSEVSLGSDESHKYSSLFIKSYQNCSGKEEHNEKLVSSEAGNNVEIRNKRSSECAASKANTEASMIDNSDQEYKD